MSAASRAPSPGARLQRAREALGLSIENAAERLHLSAALVLAMEQDRLALLGPPVYARGHLRNYAALLGVPESEVLGGGHVDELPEPRLLPALEPVPRPRGLRWAWPVAALLLAIALVLVFGWWTAAGP